MPETAENVAEDFGITREDQDAFALRSQERALKAIADGRFDREITPVEISQRKSAPLIVDTDEHPRQTSPAALAKLPTPFRSGGTVTAGNSSGVNDGAAVVLLASESAVLNYGLEPLARISGAATAGVPPRIMGIGPVPSTRKLLARHRLSIEDLDIVELNEAFAAQALAVLRQLGLPDDAGARQPQRRCDRSGPPVGREWCPADPHRRSRTGRAGRTPRARHHVRRCGAGHLGAHRTPLTGTPTAPTKGSPMQDLSPRPGDLEPIETASRDEIQALQLERMRWSLRHAYDNVPFYRRAFDERGVHPDDLKQLSDLALFPFTVKNDLRDNYPFGMFAVPQSEIRRIHGSSGTTGKPIVVGYTANDLDMWANVVARSIRAAGGRPGMKVHNAYGYGLFTGGLGLHAGAERLGCTVIPMSGGQTERQVQLIVDFEPEIVVVTPSYMLAILDEMDRQGVDPRSTALQVGIFGAEPWTEDMRREIEQRLDMHAVDIYGLSEVIGPGVANETVETKDGLHIWEDHFYPEVIDPITGEVLPEGEKGELVFTSLTKEAFPIVRYRTRDLTRLLPGTARSMRRMEKITGRSDDMIILRGVNLFPSQVEEILLGIPGLTAHFQLVLTRPGRMDELAVRVEARPDAGADEARTALAAQVRQRVKDVIGVSVAVDVLEPFGMERSLGKARRIIDQRPR